MSVILEAQLKIHVNSSQKNISAPARIISLIVLRGFLVCLFIFTAGSSFAAGWKLVWSDEFDKPGLPDPAKWNYETGFIRNHEAQYYTDARLENARVENGMLVIEARKESFKNPDYDPTAGTNNWKRSREFAAYTSACLTTQERVSWKYGRIEVRAKLPAGRGVWPAIWMLGTNRQDVGWPACGEIDIMEMVGFRPDMIYGHIHTTESVTTKKIHDGTGIKPPVHRIIFTFMPSNGTLTTWTFLWMTKNIIPIPIPKPARIPGHLTGTST